MQFLEPTVILTATCPLCHHTSFVEVAEASFAEWQNGELAQNAFPYLSATNREILISGLCPHCQKEIFGGDD